MRHMTKIALWFVLATAVVLAQDSSQRVSKLGTVKSLSGGVLTLKADSGAEVSVSVPDGIRIVRLAPGQTDLKSAAPMQLQEVQAGDRMLVRGTPGDKPDSLVANSIVVMKQGDVAQKQQQDLQDWQRRGAGGIVTAIDAASGVITVSVTPAISVMVKTAPTTSYLRYAPNSVKFADAVKGNFSDIKMGDQLRARGSRSADGKELAAVEVISGSFRNIAGTVSSLDASSGTVTVKDILAKKSVVVKLTPESQVRKLPPQMAQRIAFFLKSPAGAAAGGAAANNGGNTAANGNAPATASPASHGGPGANGGFRQGGGGPPDFQQMISRLPAATLADLQKDDAVMIVATPGTSGNEVTAITLLGGVEPILTASPNGAAALLSGWNLSAPGGGGEGGGPQ
ncbi:MAG TPA: hypothetical protein VKT33_11635 [Candidatus Angelobacter sp.]|nr:hypothetical protein [Candidatus Angelobacter sp.]